MRSSGSFATVVAARCFAEAVAFAMFAALAQVMTTGTEPVPLVATTLALFGIGLALVTLQRERGAERRSATILVVTLAGGVVWGMLLRASLPDGLAVLSRAVLFGLIAEAFLWRNLTVARAGTRWPDVRDGAVFASVALIVTALAPGPIDRGALAFLALALVIVSALGLSLARTTEELALSRGTRGTARASSAAGVSFVVGISAVLTAALMPGVQNALGVIGTALEPLVTRVIYALVLPLGYIAAFIVQLLAPLLAGLRMRDLFRPPVVRSVEDEETLLREIERNRPIVFGALELIVVAVAAIVAVVLFDRMLRERRTQIPAGVTLERSSAEGIGLGATLRALLPHRRPRRQGPRDDGTPSAALRVLYWRFLRLAERRGAGWRDPNETPGEHLSRTRAGDPRWSTGEPLVRAFEDLRYGDEPPDAPTLQRARDAVATLEEARRAY